MFPRPTDDELARLSKFGGPRSFRSGERAGRVVFAVPDIRSGSVELAAASVGDGAQLVAAIHQYLAAQEKERTVSIQPQMQVTAAK